MITKELLKSEIDKVREEYFAVLYRIIQALEEPGSKTQAPEADWGKFVAETYGSFADDPLERGEQGTSQERIPFE
jgi:hypothetical protein